MSDAARSPEVRFEAPGPGTWVADGTHWPRPLTRFVGKAYTDSFTKGFKEGSARYGLLLSHFEAVLINDFWYHQPVPVAVPRRAAQGTPPRLVFQRLLRLHPALRKRIRSARLTFERRIWREDLRRWDEEAKPRSIKAHKQIQAVDPSTLGTSALCEHVRRCRAHLEYMMYQHHRFTMPACIPVGDFLAHASAWTELTTGELLRCLTGASPISAGIATAKLGALGRAVRADSKARKLVDEGGAGSAALEALQRWPGPLGEAAREYIDEVGFRGLGYDVCDPYVLELPDVLLTALRSEVEQTQRADPEDATEQHTQAVREKVPEALRGQFDGLLAEARLVHRLRDERGVYSDGWASGLARRAVLAAGKRLEQSGTLAEAALAVDASCDELVDLLQGRQGPSSDELRARAQWRTTRSAADNPAWLGTPPAPPLPLQWLPPDARRVTAAIGIYIDGVLGDSEKDTSKQEIRGVPASPGTREGRARVIFNQQDLKRVQSGDILVTRSTSPYFNFVLPLLCGIVTERGGQLSHAAIISREYGIPGVVGTQDATQRIPDGARIRIDGTRGEVTILP